MRQILVAALLVMLAGCTSYAGLRDLPIAKSETFRVGYEQLGHCILEGLRLTVQTFGYTSAIRPEKKTYRIAAEFKTLLGTPGVGFAWEVAVMQGSPSDSKVEARSLSTIWGTPSYPSEAVWGIVHECAKG